MWVHATGGEIPWKDLVLSHIVQRLKHLTLLLPKFDLPACKLTYVTIEPGEHRYRFKKNFRESISLPDRLS